MLSEDEIYTEVQSIFRSTPVLLIGSGFSCGYGLPGMGQLGEHLIKHVGGRLENDESRKLWDIHVAAIKSDLESGLNNIANGAEGRSELVTKIREVTASLIIDKTHAAEQSIINNIPHLGHAPSRLIRRLFQGAPQNADCISIITTNYDTLIETFCDLANVPIDTGFSGFRHRWARENNMFETSYIRSTTVNSRSGHGHYDHRPYLTARLLKPHGSINWRATPSGPVEILHQHGEGPNSIIVPGPSKYEDSLINTLFDTVRAEMNKTISKAKSLVTFGFGFNDQHLQGAIEMRLAQRMPTIIIARDLTPSATATLAKNPHVIAINRRDAGAELHKGSETLYFTDPIWEIDTFLKIFLE